MVEMCGLKWLRSGMNNKEISKVTGARSNNILNIINRIV